MNPFGINRDCFNRKLVREMVEDQAKHREFLSQKERFVALLCYVVIMLITSRIVTGVILPSESGQRLWVLSGIGMWFFVLLSAPWFRPPRDSLINGVTTILLLGFLDFSTLSQLRTELNVFRWISITIAFLVAVSAITAIVFRDSDPIVKPRLCLLSNIGYRLSDNIGKGEVLFSCPALISIVGYYQGNPIQQLWLLFLWVFLISVRPVDMIIRLYIQLKSTPRVGEKIKFIGKICQVDNPGIIRVVISSVSSWNPKNVAAACLPHGEQVYVLPLFHHISESQLIGTGLCYGQLPEPIKDAYPCYVYSSELVPSSAHIISKLSGIGEGAALIGFIVEDSNIGAIKFEVSPMLELEEGLLTFCRQHRQTIFYQILDVHTAEESFEQNPRGKHIVKATQLGIYDPVKGFVKYGWVPAINAPVFRSLEAITLDVRSEEDEFEIGKIPGSNLGVRASFYDILEYHASILGVTGTGKTEFALEVITKGLSLNAKIFCVDFTGEYKARLSDYNPQILGLEQQQAEDLDSKLFAIETGTYGAPAEKKALKEFVDEIQEPVAKQVDEFLSAEGAALGVFELPKITNSKATLRATELYLSNIMEWARKHRRARKILIVLEEAHTIIPETAWSGFDNDTQWVVSKISQIALQGRKYGVGLLIVTQRTALVSKSILSQCNTNFTFTLVDKTSLDYLSNIYSQEHARAVPNLRSLEMIAYGKAIKSDKPILAKIPYDELKKQASRDLDHNIGEDQTPDDQPEKGEEGTTELDD